MPKSRFVRNVPCEQCNSSDGAGLYEDGSMYCHKNNHVIVATVDVVPPNDIDYQLTDNSYSNELITGTVQALTKRGLTKETCERYHYHVGLYKGRTVQIENYFVDNVVVAQKLRSNPKDFQWLGDHSQVGLFGDHLQRKGKRLAITEGAIDAMSLSQALGNTWPVWSLLDGAGSADKEIKRNIDMFQEFEQIVLMFDMDEAGQQAVSKILAAKLFPIGKLCIANLSSKDANDMLQKGKVKELVRAYWDAVPYKPNGMVDKDTRYKELFATRAKFDYELPYPLLQQMLNGIRKGEVVLVCGGTGLGKSTFVREIGFDLMQKGEKVGFITLEEAHYVTDEILLGMYINKMLRMNPELKDDPNLHKIAKEQLIPNSEIYDDQGSMSPQELEYCIEYMAVACDCKWIILDHISMASLPNLAAAMNQVVYIDTNMTNIRKLAQRLGITVFVVSHLAKIKDGDSFEKGRPVEIESVRGSGTLYTIPNTIIALEGDMYDNTNTVRLKGLKCRFLRGVGYADTLTFSNTTGRYYVDNVLKEI